MKNAQHSHHGNVQWDKIIKPPMTKVKRTENIKCWKGYVVNS